MKASEKDFTKCHEMAKKLAEGDGFNRELLTSSWTTHTKLASVLMKLMIPATKVTKAERRTQWKPKPM